ncbi:hypothetical protein T440DRAFT_227918 [Plenodomus tracheiphilus IPT5]|uniref:BTB domain-containing protein n=1 Tax=Plenodomus tracheiphilus IPT5 TaxID=1408161 RepID=A0A6A7AWJ8_9PLEO|nr:hypothetical protein T440DRAFT_227918 [Plenodomus tracheiphilus IPT5]
MTEGASPPTTTSRASTTTAESIDLNSALAQPAEAPLSIVGSDDQSSTKYKQSSDARSNFKPHQMLMQTIISVECGNDLTATPIIIHEEMLCCYSKLFNQNREKAKVLRNQYAECRHLLKALGAHVFPEVTSKQFENDRLELKVIPLILDISMKYPLKGNQRGLREVIDNAIDEAINNKNVKPLSFTTGPQGVKKKEVRDMTRTAGLDKRLGFLNSHGVRIVAERLYSKLHRIDKQEKSKAKTDALVAVAQNRILLPDTDEATVQLLVQWIYHNTLDVRDARQIYELMSLANKLGVDVLRESCLSTLASSLTDTLQAARVASLPLMHLLGYGSQPANQLLETVFNKVFLEADSPTRLKGLVIDAIADDLDKELWTYLKTALNPELALSLIEAIVRRGLVKNEQTAAIHMKTEADGATAGQLLQTDAGAHDPTGVA